jgi:hypothetical protein
MIRTVKKIHLIDGAFVGAAGDSDYCNELIEWFRTSRQPSTFPRDRPDDVWGSMLVVWPKADGQMWLYERTPYPTKFDAQPFAIGSGRDYAMAAMHCGRTARGAVQVASFFDSSCGNGIDILPHPGTTDMGE